MSRLGEAEFAQLALSYDYASTEPLIAHDREQRAEIERLTDAARVRDARTEPPPGGVDVLGWNGKTWCRTYAVSDRPGGWETWDSFEDWPYWLPMPPAPGATIAGGGKREPQP